VKKRKKPKWYAPQKEKVEVFMAGRVRTKHERRSSGGRYAGRSLTDGVLKRGGEAFGRERGWHERGGGRGVSSKPFFHTGPPRSRRGEKEDGLARRKNRKEVRCVEKKSSKRSLKGKTHERGGGDLH